MVCSKSTYLSSVGRAVFAYIHFELLRPWQKILSEKKARYSELAKRLEREKTLALMERRMGIKRHLQVWGQAGVD